MDECDAVACARMTTRWSCAALLLVTAVLATGCGADTKAQNAYVADVQQVQETFVTRFGQALGRLTPTSTLPQDRATLGQFASVTRAFGTSLERIKPPGTVRDQHRALVATVARFRQQFVQAQSALRRGSAADRARVRTQLSSSVADTQTRVTKAIADINAGLRD